jgi:hypothetical protein
MFRYAKEQDRFFSHRFFARKAGFSSPNFLKLVMSSQRNLTHESIVVRFIHSPAGAKVMKIRW